MSKKRTPVVPVVPVPAPVAAPAPAAATGRAVVDWRSAGLKAYETRTRNRATAIAGRPITDLAEAQRIIGVSAPPSKTPSKATELADVLTRLVTALDGELRFLPRSGQTYAAYQNARDLLARLNGQVPAPPSLPAALRPSNQVAKPEAPEFVSEVDGPMPRVSRRTAAATRAQVKHEADDPHCTCNTCLETHERRLAEPVAPTAPARLKIAARAAKRGAAAKSAKAKKKGGRS